MGGMVSRTRQVCVREYFGIPQYLVLFCRSCGGVGATLGKTTCAVFVRYSFDDGVGVKR